MFASNFIIADTHLKHLRGRDNLKSFGQKHTIASGNNMTNYFCSTCVARTGYTAELGLGLERPLMTILTTLEHMKKKPWRRPWTGYI